MKYGFVRAALVSPRLIPGAVDNNKFEVLRTIRSAAERGAEVIMTGRLSLCGYTCGSLFHYSNLLQGCIDALVYIVNETQSLGQLTIVGLPMKMANRIYDCSAVIFKGRVLAFLPHDSSDEVFSSYPEGEVTYIKMDGHEVPFGKDIIIYNSEMDFSIKFDDAPSYLPAAELVLRPLAAVKTMSSSCRELELCRSYSIANNCAMLSVSCSQSACADKRIYSSDKFAMELGRRIDVVDSKNEEVVIAEIDAAGIAHRLSFAGSSALGEYNYVTVDYALNNNDTLTCREVAKFPLAPNTEEDFEDAISIVMSGIAAKLAETNQQKVIIGLSGGLDSTNVLMLCHQLFARNNMPLENIITVCLPSSHTSRRTLKNAKRLVELLGVSNITIPILIPVKRHLKDIEHYEQDVVYENAQARERTQILLDLANKHNALLLGTGDLSEMCLGFTTYGGDQVAHYNPNGGLTKTAIRFLTKYFIETLSYKDLTKTLRDILKTPISPELLDDQLTENILGSYEIHDFFLSCVVDKGYDMEKTLYLSERAFRDRQRKDLHAMLKLFVERFFAGRFKQAYSCDYPTVISEHFTSVISSMRGGFSSEQWQKEITNLKQL